MGFQVGGALLDFLVLSILRRGDAYGYILTQEVRTILDVSETSLSPPGRRWKKGGLLPPYDSPYRGRNRRYYRLTSQGQVALEGYIAEWRQFKKQMDSLLGEDEA